MLKNKSSNDSLLLVLDVLAVLPSKGTISWLHSPFVIYRYSGNHWLQFNCQKNAFVLNFATYKILVCLTNSPAECFIMFMHDFLHWFLNEVIKKTKFSFNHIYMLTLIWLHLCMSNVKKQFLTLRTLWVEFGHIHVLAMKIMSARVLWLFQVVST